MLLWAAGCFHVRSLSPAVRWILVAVPLMLIGVELITVEGRYNTVEKMWGYTYGAGLIALFPIVALRAGFDEAFVRARASGLSGFFPPLLAWTGLGCRILTLVLLFSACVSLYGWLFNAIRWAPWNGGICHLEGDHYIIIDDQKKKMLQVMKQVKGGIFLSGKCIWCYNESPALAVFSGNKSYIAWSYFESVADYPDVATYREMMNNNFYEGAMTDPLTFLTTNRITGVVIWPDDDIPDAVLAKLTSQISPAFDYIDLKGNGGKNAGVFLRRG
jgi:hypothetical protein